MAGDFTDRSLWPLGHPPARRSLQLASYRPEVGIRPHPLPKAFPPSGGPRLPPRAKCGKLGFLCRSLVVGSPDPEEPCPESRADPSRSILLLLVAIPGTALARPDRPSPTTGGDRSADPRVTVPAERHSGCSRRATGSSFPTPRTKDGGPTFTEPPTATTTTPTGRCCGGGEYLNFFTFHR